VVVTVDRGVVVTMDGAGTEQGAGGLASGAGPELLDRQAERAAIDQALRSARDGFSATLLIQGGTGVGKTALLRYAADSAADMRVCSVTGIETEIALEFAALHQLLVPFLPGVDDLPGPQRLALRVAFGMEQDPAADPFLVGLAALTLLAGAAEERPVLCLVDDGQWLDAESAHALGFVARRLYADRVALLIAAGGHAAGHAFGQLPAVQVGGLPPEAARRLLRWAAQGPVDDRVGARILADTERNPLALVEVGAEFTASEMAGQAARPEPMPLGRRLTDRFARQAVGLDPDTQVFLLIVAADASGDRAVLWRAARQGGIDADAAADAAESAGLVELSPGSVRFRYPLIRSAVYHGAADRYRRRAHLLLSEAMEASRDPDLVAWHRGSAATGPDEAVAAELERAADRARARGGYAARAALLRRSVQLTPDDRHRADRELKLGEAELRSGSHGAAQELVDAALPRVSDPSTHARAVRLRGEILLAQGHAAESAQVLAGAARLMIPGQPAAREALAAAMRAAIWAGPAQTKKVAAAAAAFPRPARSQSSADLLLDGYAARYTTGYTAAITPLRAGLSLLQSEDLEPVGGLLCYGMGAMAAGSLWDADSLLDITARFLRAARALGALAVLPVALELRAVAECVVGRFAEAQDRCTETREIMAASQGPQIFSIDSRSEGLVLVYTGRVPEARAAGTAQIQESVALGQDGRADVGRAIVARAELCAGNYDAAIAAAATVAEHDMTFTADSILPELIEAACRSDRRSAASAAFHILSERTHATGTPWALGVRARCEALLADGDRAEEAYLEAIRHLEHSHGAVDLARCHLHYGQWQRRAKRRRDARRELRTAYDMFEAMGAKDFAASAAAELRATGEPAPPRTQVSTPDLTPQEARVAGLAAEGVTTNQIAAQLFISPRTVDYHLGKVFRTLGISSRGQLARHLTVGAVATGR
jgi:DNA-binding CsgD family transcriptional regulator/tetratricopeptide (TPR) repeat protein